MHWNYLKFPFFKFEIPVLQGVGLYFSWFSCSILVCKIKLNCTLKQTESKSIFLVYDFF